MAFQPLPDINKLGVVKRWLLQRQFLEGILHRFGQECKDSIMEFLHESWCDFSIIQKPVKLGPGGDPIFNFLPVRCRIKMKQMKLIQI